jgi:DNA-binding SARP family transcriptional activator
VELGVLGPLQVRQDGAPVAIPGAKPRAILTMLGLHGGSVVGADVLVELIWDDDPPRTAVKALQTHISSLRHTLGDGFVLTEGAGWRLSTTEIDASRYKLAAKLGRDAAAAGDISEAVGLFEEALGLWRGIPELPDGHRGTAEKTRWIEGHAALVEDRADALLATGRAAEVIGDLEAAVSDAPLRERRWGQLMLALYRAGRQGEALGAYRRARSLLADELGVDPGPDLRRLEAAIVAQDAALEIPASQDIPAVTRAVTFLLTDIEGSTTAWEADAVAMAVALARHDELVEQVVTSRGGRLIKTRGEGDATFSVFDRPSAAAAAAIELQEAIAHEPWALREPMRIRVALHSGEAELRDGDYFGRAVNRAARLRSLAAGGQILCSGATAELVIDSLRDDVLLTDLGMRQLKNLARPEHVFELRLETADDGPQAPTTVAPMERPGVPTVLAGHGPFVGRGRELERLLSAWQTALAGGMLAVLLAGEPGVGKTRLAGEWSRHAYEQGAIVLYGRCDEDLGAPYQPFAEALRPLMPCLGGGRLRGLRGVESLLALVPGLTDVLPDLSAPSRADADTERYALFDAVVALLGIASTSAPVVLILDDLHWAAKPTLLLLRHLLRFGEHARVQIVGTYRSTDLDRSHPLAAMLADLHRDGTASRIQLTGLDETDVSAYLAEAGYDDEELARALASVTGGNPFFLIEALRHVDESGGVWDPSTLPQGVREAVSRRLSRLPAETNKALAAAAVVGSRFALDLVEQVVDQDLVDAFDEACKAGIIIEEPGGRYRFNHALVRQSLLAELASVRRMRLHQRIATTLENSPGADDELLAELAHHYFECAWAGNAAKAVDYCRRAADQAMARLAYEGAADLYDRALHAMDELDDDLPDRDDQRAELSIARCEALLAAGDMASAAGAVAQLREATLDSPRLTAWATCFDGQLSMLTDPERLDEIESAVGAAADKLAGLDDAAGEAKAHTVRAGCLERLGRIADCEVALDHALTAARGAREHRRVNAVLAGAPLAALWGPNPVSRAGGRCLDVVRLLRITSDSPAVEATSTRCQAVLDAFRGRSAAARRMMDSTRRTVTELGLRHALLEVEHFAGIVELVADDPASAESHLRLAYDGFRRLGLDADAAEAAALLGRACLALDRDDEADELCSESERLAGHALRASIAWRTLRAQLLARGGAHDEARRVAEEAVAVAERTDALVDHGDACLALATVLSAAGDAAGARAAAERAAGLYERKGATALVAKTRNLLGDSGFPPAPAAPEAPTEEMDNACVRAIRRLEAAIGREAWGEVEQQLATDVSVEARRKIVGFPRTVMSSSEWTREARHLRETSAVRHRNVVLAVRGERLALTRSEQGTEDEGPGAPQVEVLRLIGLDKEGRIALYVAFDIEDIDAAVAELDAMHAGFEELEPRTPLENAASRTDDRAYALFADRRWDEIGALFADDIRIDDRRQGLRRESNDRATAVNNLSAIAAVGVADITKTPLALRGDRLFLSLVLYEVHDTPTDAFGVETLEITEVDTDGVLVARVLFDPDDVDAAFEELDARYLVGEAAPSADAWQIVVDANAALNRHEPLPTAWHVAYTDHRRIPFGPGDFGRAVEELWTLVPDASYRATAVHALEAHGAVIDLVIEGTSANGGELQWTRILVVTRDSGQVRVELYEEEDLDAALARFEELRPLARPLENTACQVYDHVNAYFASRDLAALAETIATDVVDDDRRRVVNNGVRRGRDAVIANVHTAADLGARTITYSVIATRGDRVALCGLSFSGQGPEAFQTEALGVVEIDPDERETAHVTFDANDFDAAFAELNTRYLAGEAADHSHTWSLIARAYAALNRHELPATTPDWVNVDHRRATSFAPGDMTAFVRTAWDVAPEISIYIEAVHALSDRGAVVTHAVKGTSQVGFDAEWRVIALLTVDGDLINRCELFDEVDIDAALAKFDELDRPARRLENAASRVDERLQACISARAWELMAEMLADDTFIEDRRRVVNAGFLHGRDAVVAILREAVGRGVTNITTAVIATRGERLALVCARYSANDERTEAFPVDVLGIVEIDADGRIAARVLIDPDDMDAAFEELDARYLAGEAADHSQMWSVVAGAYASVNRRELPATTPDWINIDHRRATAVAPGDLTESIRATWDLTPDFTERIEAVHRLSQIGAVVTRAATGTSHEGFDAEWRVIDMVTVEGDLINRCEIFDEADINAAIARFDELSRPVPRLENAASQVYERFWNCYVTDDWDALAEMLAVDYSSDDRRRVVGAGVRHGRDGAIANLRVAADLGFTNAMASVIATRGRHLALHRVRGSDADEQSEVSFFNIVEINPDDRMAAIVVFDPDDIDVALEELDTRYLAGEAADHAHTWSVITAAYAALIRHELPSTTPDWVNLDHRRGIGFAPGDMTAYIRAKWDLEHEVSNCIEGVHRLNDLGAVFTQVVRATTEEDFEAEWRVVELMTVQGDLINRAEFFDEADLDTALARFDELSPRAPRLENAASDAHDRVKACFAARDWDGVGENVADDIVTDDRRRVVNAGRLEGPKSRNRRP